MLAKIPCLLLLAATLTVTTRPDTACTRPSTPVTVQVLANDGSSGPPLDPSSVTISRPSPDGIAKVHRDGTVTFTPADDFVGITNYGYRVCDTATPKPVCATAVVTINVTADPAGCAAAPVAPGTPGGVRKSTGTTPGTSGGIRVSIKNVYEAKLNFGPLGGGTRNGTDIAEGVLERQGNDYVGILNANVDSTQGVTGLGTNCGPARYTGSQKLRVVGRPTTGFNPLVQSVAPAAMTGQASSEYLSLEFAPETMTSQQTSLRRPEDMLPDLVVSCHTLIDTLSGIAFLPLNDTRWTMEGGGYIIALPSSGVLAYTDTEVAEGAALTLGPFQATKSIWTIRVERLP
jgi:hypothetical protein